MIAELANSMQEQSQKQFKEILDLFKATLNTNTSPTPTTPKGGAGKKKKKCPHCKTEVYHKPKACFELDANAAKRPVGWKSKKAPEGARRSSPQSSGDRARLISLN